jgi:hypothetical protein
MNSSSICIVCPDNTKQQQAKALATQSGLPLLDEISDDFDLQLCFDDDHVKLFDTALNTRVFMSTLSRAHWLIASSLVAVVARPSPGPSASSMEIHRAYSISPPALHGMPSFLPAWAAKSPW